MRFFLFALFVVLFAACATPRYRGMADSIEDHVPINSFEIKEEIKEHRYDENFPVTVMIRETPEGISWNENEVVIAPEYQDKYEVLASIASSRSGDNWSAFARSALFYVNMHEKHGKFRDGYCKVWLPFRVLLGPFWSIAPFQWPCYAWFKDNNEESTYLHTQELKRLAFILGGNLVLVKEQVTLNSLRGVVLIKK
ncbi:MAG: hypothetical protein GY847_04455 [Proteobacteria bacterium]|nr:hypothetical protein [Pseudomonadota bacterium]